MARTNSSLTWRFSGMTFPEALQLKPDNSEANMKFPAIFHAHTHNCHLRHICSNQSHERLHSVQMSCRILTPRPAHLTSGKRLPTTTHQFSWHKISRFWTLQRMMRLNSKGFAVGPSQLGMANSQNTCIRSHFST
jgi:hypothetical protein